MVKKNQIPVVEKFQSIQGEGVNIGMPYYFIRVGGCPLRCNFCDSEYTWSANSGKIVEVDDLINSTIKECELYGINWVSITGGEPLLYKNQVLKIIEALNLNGILTHIETSGRYYDMEIHGSCSLYSPDAKTPCTGESMEGFFLGIENMRSNDQVKCLINDDNDLRYAHDVSVALQNRCPLVLQPFNDGIFTNSRSNMGDEMRSRAPEDQLSINDLRIRLGESLRRLMDAFHESRKSGVVWGDTIITPQIHVLAYGNQKAR